MHVSNFVAMTCVSPLIRIVTTFSFTVTQLACFPIPKSSATCNMVRCLVNWLANNIILTIPSLLCLNVIIPLTIMNYELS